MDLDLRECALHEAAHACYASAIGWDVLSLRVSSEDDGVSSISLPFRKNELPADFRRAPIQTRAELVCIIGVLLAPSIVLGIPINGSDHRELQTWQYVWDGCKWAHHEGLDWPVLERVATEDVRCWLAQPGTQRRLAVVAQELAQRRFLSGKDFLNLSQR